MSSAQFQRLNVLSVLVRSQRKYAASLVFSNRDWFNKAPPLAAKAPLSSLGKRARRAGHALLHDM
jgi:hypothetical protein